MANPQSELNKERLDILKIAGKRFADARMSCGCSVQTIARRTGYSRGSIYDFERGTTNNAFIALCYLQWFMDKNEAYELIEKLSLPRIENDALKKRNGGDL